MRIVSLIGPSGAGKSTTGCCLANKLSWAFLDSDVFIEQEQGLCIPDIFERLGEPAFRRMETSLLENLAKDPTVFAPPTIQGMIFATGGGLPVNPENFQILQNIGVIIALTAPTDILVTRVTTKSNRPLLNVSQGWVETSSDNENLLRERLANLIKQRRGVYERPQYKIDTSNLNPEEVSDQIIRLLSLS